MFNKMLIILMASLGLYSQNGYAMNPAVASSVGAESAADVKRAAEPINVAGNQRLSQSEYAALLEKAATATQEEKDEYLEWAFFKERMPAFQFWLAHGAQLSVLTNAPLNTYLAEHDNKSLNKLKILLELGADPNSRDWRREVPLYTAVAYGNIEGAKILIAHPRTVIPDDILEHATANCHPIYVHQRECTSKKIVKLLLSIGRNTTHTNHTGTMIAANNARKRDREDIAQIIEDHRHIDKYCTPEELDEFRQVMLVREGKSFKYLMNRQAGIRVPLKIRPKTNGKK